MILIILFIVNVFCVIELHRSFTDGLLNQKFQSDGGWYMKRTDFALDPLINSGFVAGTQYFGLNLIYKNDGLVKKLTDIPPHSILQISCKMAVYGKKQLGYRKIVLRIDNVFVQTTEVYSTKDTDQNNPYLFEINCYFVHTYPTAIIQFTNDFDGFLGLPTMGIRDFIVSYTPCPAGCLVCGAKDKSNYCSQWVLQHSAFQRDSQFSNDGWETLKKISYFNCQGINFGPFDNTVRLNRTLLLDPHYLIRIIFLFTQVDLEEDQLTNYHLELDSVKVYDFRQYKQLDFPDLCDDQKKMGDLLQRADLQIQHTRRKMTLSFYQFILSGIQASKFIMVGLDAFFFHSKKYFQIFIKKCYNDEGCDECTGPAESDCIWSTKALQVSDAAQSDFSPTGAWQVIQPLLMSPLICNIEYMLGLDPSIVKDYYLQKNFKNLPPHKQITISFDLYQIDDFQNEIIEVILDGVVIDSYSLSPLDYRAQFLCYNELQYDMDFKKSISIDHSDIMASIQFVSRQTQTLSTFGIKNFRLAVDFLNITSDLDTLISTTLASYNFDDCFATKIIDQLHFDTIICPGVTLLGVLSPNQRITRRVKILNQHKEIRIRFTIYVFSSILNNQYFKLTIDAQPIWNQVLDEYCYEICPGQQGQIIEGDIFISHNKSVAFFEFTTSAYMERWGVSQFIMQTLN